MKRTSIRVDSISTYLERRRKLAANDAPSSMFTPELTHEDYLAYRRWACVPYIGPFIALALLLTIPASPLRTGSARSGRSERA
jgi:hypothetical protein